MRRLQSFIDSGSETIRVGMASRFAVLGSPIKHSLSPAIHTAAFATIGRDAEYTRVELGSDLAGWVAGLGAEWLGLSLTMPLKEQALDVADYLDPLAIASLSANTLVRDGDTWLGYNTDIFGLQQATKPLDYATVGILGTGATARSALLAFESAEPLIWGRNSDKVVALAEAHGGRFAALETVLAADLVVSTLPAGVLGELAGGSSYPGTLLDVVYNQTASELGYSETISGLEMLVWQALGQQRLFAGQGLAEPFEDEVTIISAMRRAAGMEE